MGDLAKSLQSKRKSAGLTQEALAQRIGTTRQAISSWERGITEPDISTLEKLADIYAVDINALVSGKPAASSYIKFQKPYLKIAISTSVIATLICILQVTLYPYLRNVLANNYDGSAFFLFLYQMTVPTIGWFLCGIFFVDFLLLFYNVTATDFWKRIFVVLGFGALLPSLLVGIDCIFGNIFSRYVPYFIYNLYFPALKYPLLQLFLFKIFPLCSGSLCFMGFLKPGKKAGLGIQEKGID